MKINLHTHSTWCDGADSPRRIAESAIEKGFDVIGFSSHAMLPADPLGWPLTAAKIPGYAAEIRALAKEFASRIEIRLGVEADYVKGACFPDRKTYAALAPDYIIGSIHFVVAPDGAWACVDENPQRLVADVREHFGGLDNLFSAHLLEGINLLLESWNKLRNLLNIKLWAQQ